MNIAGVGAGSWQPQTQNRNQTGQNLPGGDAASASASGNFADAVSGGGSSPATITPAKTSQDDAVAQFTAYMKETPAQRMEDAWLSEHGISKQQFAAMSPADKQKLMNQMKQEIEERLKQQVEGTSKGTPKLGLNILA